MADCRLLIEIKRRIRMANDSLWRHQNILRSNINIDIKKRQIYGYVFSVVNKGLQVKSEKMRLRCRFTGDRTLKIPRTEHIFYYHHEDDHDKHGRIT